MGADISTDLLVVGSGIAGLTVALHAAKHCRVTIISKADAWEGATDKAQGGIAAVLSPTDTPAEHVRDTVSAGAGLCNREAAEICAGEGPGMIAWLQELGVPFARTENGDWDLGREGGHKKRRVAHVKDLTGREVERTLLARVREDPRIQVLERYMGVDLITDDRHNGAAGKRCVGIYAMDMATNEIITVRAGVTVLATGGSGKVYLYTTNPDVATGDGVAMAWRAGARIANMEFYQFHPTCLYHPLGGSFLISEAVRGEGGRLLLRDGSSFMERYHEMGDLAPRDVVARAIDYELKKSGHECVYLDVTHLQPDFVKGRFPNIHGHCADLGLDICTQPIPVVPAAHYQCGGVQTDLQGWTEIPGLYAIGECACTGLHGANRLASNSLLEGLVFGRRAAVDALKYMREATTEQPSIPQWNIGYARNPEEAVVVSQNWHEIRRFMWNYVGLVRSNARLERARRRLMTVREEIRSDYWSFILTPHLVELRNLADTAWLVLEMASTRKESRGLHYNLDYPEKDDAHWLHDSVLVKKRPGVFR
jgi:L-aspartate oxidase